MREAITATALAAALTVEPTVAPTTTARPPRVDSVMPDQGMCRAAAAAGVRPAATS